MRSRLLPVVTLLVLSLASPGFADLTIDNFEEGAFSFTGGNAPTNQFQTALNPANTLGAQRSETIRSLAAGETVSAVLTLGPGDDSVDYTSAASGGSFSTAYNDFGLPTLDLTDGGTADRIEVDLNQADVGGTVKLELLDEFFGTASPSLPIIGPGTYTFPFSGISGVDMSRIQVLQVDLDTAGPGHLRIIHVRAASAAIPGVPTLSPPLLVLCALLLLGAAAYMLAGARRSVD